MAVKFYRITEKGDFKRPTLTALGNFAALALISVIFLYDYPIICMLVVWPAEYVLCAFFFKKPVRVTLSWVMHVTRYPIITSKPVFRPHRLWEEANEELLKKTGLKLFKGISEKSPD